MSGFYVFPKFHAHLISQGSILLDKHTSVSWGVEMSFIIYKRHQFISNRFCYLHLCHIYITNTNIVILSQIALEFLCFYLEITWKIHGISSPEKWEPSITTQSNKGKHYCRVEDFRGVSRFCYSSEGRGRKISPIFWGGHPHFAKILIIKETKISQIRP